MKKTASYLRKQKNVKKKNEKHKSNFQKLHAFLAVDHLTQVFLHPDWLNTPGPGYQQHMQGGRFSWVGQLWVKQETHKENEIQFSGSRNTTKQNNNYIFYNKIISLSKENLKITTTNEG